MQRAIVLIVITAAIGGALFALQRLGAADMGVRMWEVPLMNEMVYSTAVESMTPNELLPLGQTQQNALPGVVVRGRPPFRYGPGAEEAARAGRELTNPFADDRPEVLARAADLYEVYCIVCHGATGAGDGTVVRGTLRPPSLMGARAMTIEDGEIYHILTLGQNTMASYADQITPEDRWKVIRHVRALQEAAQ